MPKREPGLVLLSPFVNLLLRHLQSAKGLLGLGIVMPFIPPV